MNKYANKEAVYEFQDYLISQFKSKNFRHPENDEEKYLKNFIVGMQVEIDNIRRAFKKPDQVSWGLHWALLHYVFLAKSSGHIDVGDWYEKIKRDFHEWVIADDDYDTPNILNFVMDPLPIERLKVAFRTFTDPIQYLTAEQILSKTEPKKEEKPKPPEYKFSYSTNEFLRAWSEGSTRASLKLTPGVLKDLRKTVTQDSYNLFRGIKVKDDYEAYQKLGMPLEDIEVGKEGTLNLTSPTSATHQKYIAQEFANLRYDSNLQEDLSDYDLENMGYDEGDELGTGVVIEITAKESSVLADLQWVNQDVMNSRDEDEVILKGPIQFKILSVKTYYFEREDE